MKVEQLLGNIDTSLARRKLAASQLIKDPSLIKLLIRTILRDNKDFGPKALMILEVLGRSNFELIEGYFSNLLKAAKKYKHSSSRRYLSKIFGFGIKSHFQRNTQFQLEPVEIQTIIKLSFSWLIEDEKVAVQVFSMQNIFDLRHEESWIGGELKGILEKEITLKSAGYRARASKLLMKLQE